VTLRILLVVLVVANVASALALVHARHRHRQLFVQLIRLEKVRDELIDQIARDRLGMKFPEGAETVLIRP
jgi:cell division protein FtsL